MIVSGGKKRGRSLRTGLKYMIAPFIGTLTNDGVNPLSVKKILCNLFLINRLLPEKNLSAFFLIRNSPFIGALDFLFFHLSRRIFISLQVYSNDIFPV
mgnify:CR=1 FL=1